MRAKIEPLALVKVSFLSQGDAMNEFSNISAIGWVESVFKEKFGTPRQSGVVPSATGTLHFYAPYDQEDAFEGLDGFSHLWVVSVFHLVPEEEFRPKVRPPKLGGAKKVGVFASRAPYRPNRICLTVVKLEKVMIEKGKVTLKVSGLDLVEGTPILDLKPYLPYADAHPDAVTAYGLPPNIKGIEIVASPESGWDSLSVEEQVLVSQTLQAQPEPAYSRKGQSFGLALGDLNIKWRLDEKKIFIIEIERNY